jgi:hypothetical protein
LALGWIHVLVRSARADANTDLIGEIALDLADKRVDFGNDGRGGARARFAVGLGARVVSVPVDEGFGVFLWKNAVDFSLG